MTGQLVHPVGALFSRSPYDSSVQLGVVLCCVCAWIGAQYGFTNRQWHIEEVDDQDGDGMLTWKKWIADTVPTNAESVLSIMGVGREREGVRIDWKGGRDAWQYLERRADLTSTTAPWTAILAIPPPISPTNAIIDLGATNRTRFYRIRAER